MTLVITCLTDEFVVQVSDRRVRLADGSGVEDRANKAVFFCGHTTWAYTGLAQLRGMRTDEWMYELFQTVSNGLDGLTERLEKDAGPAIAQMLRTGIDTEAYRNLGRLAFIGAGYVDAGEGAVPACVVVSNFGHSNSWESRARSCFSTTARTIQPGLSFRVLCAGADMPPDILGNLQDGLEDAIDRGPHVVAHDLAVATRKVAERNRSVGKNVMCCVVPKAALFTNDFGIHGGPVFSRSGPPGFSGWFKPVLGDTSEHFYYWPESANEEDFIYYAPAYVCPGVFASPGGAGGAGPSMDDYRRNGPFAEYQFGLE